MDKGTRKVKRVMSKIPTGPNYNVINYGPANTSINENEGEIIEINLSKIMDPSHTSPTLSNLPPKEGYVIPESFKEKNKKIVRKPFGNPPWMKKGGKKISRKRKWRSQSLTRRR